MLESSKCSRMPLFGLSLLSTEQGWEGDKGLLTCFCPSGSFSPIFSPTRRRVMTCHHPLQGQPPTSTLTHGIWLNRPTVFQLSRELSLEQKLKVGAVPSHFAFALGPSPARRRSGWAVLRGPGKQNHSGQAGRVHFLEASVRDWREPVSTNGYGNSELNALGGDAQVFRPML